ncbi:MAG TPA: UDP-N-acetylmuramate dehydrogenase [Acidobacteriaceae bacterium]|nr:UDP-N-acetylmuramate dehydrogenase [Acidobacteriaceae bacterium]
MTPQENIPLAPYTTLGVGGPARFFVEATDEATILEAVRFARSQSLPFFLLGGGSNLLVSDKGFPGVVIRITSNRAPELHLEAKIAILEAEAGVPWDTVVHHAVEANCAGIECLAGIPGSVGGTPVQNVGAYGQEVSTSILRVHALDLETETAVELTPQQCGFAYRRSIFNTTHAGRYAITRVAYRLHRDQPAALAYRDLKHFFAERDIPNPSLAETAAAVREIRARKGMLLSPNDIDSRSAGSFFKNPIVPASIIPGLAAIADCHPDQVPKFPADNASITPSTSPSSDPLVKLSAAWLIELAGFHKGSTLGRTGISRKHVLAIVNRGGATALDIITLRDSIRDAVQTRTGIRLEQEPVML